MIRTIVTPKNNNILLSIPNNYIGKEIEVFLYAKEELVEQKPTKTNTASRFKGLLNNDEADKYNTYLQQTRNQWERGI
jgi:predicted metal-dependent hydrolase